MPGVLRGPRHERRPPLRGVLCIAPPGSMRGDVAPSAFLEGNYLRRVELRYQFRRLPRPDRVESVEPLFARLPSPIVSSERRPTPRSRPLNR
jgi:hypothetical protein